MPKRRIDVNSSTGVHSANRAAINGQNMCVNSQEQVYSPIQIRRRDNADRPGFELPRMTFMADGPFGGSDGANHVGPTVTELSPYFAKVFGGDGTYWFNNVDFHLMGNNGSTARGDQDLNIDKLNRDTVSTIQVNAFRGPLMLSGFGFDISDLPVPSRTGTPKGMYMFDTEAPRDRTTWKTGPVNLQWDEERKVWQGGPQIVCGIAKDAIRAPTSPCTPTSFRIGVLRRTTQPPLINVSDCYIKEEVHVSNRDPSLTQEHVPGMVFVVCARINYEWIPIWVGCPEGDGCKNEDGTFNGLSPCFTDCGCGGGIGGGGGGGGDPEGDPEGPGDNPGDQPTGDPPVSPGDIDPEGDMDL